MLLLLACAAPPPDAGPAPLSVHDETLAGPNPPRPLTVQPGLRPSPSLPRALTADVVDAPRRSAKDSVLPELWTSLRGVDLDMDLGGPLMDRLDELPDSVVAVNGVSALTLPEMWGTPEQDYEDGLCQPLGLQWSFEEGGEDWEGELLLWQYNAFAMPIDWMMIEMSPACREALDGTPPDDVGDACSQNDEVAFFREGSACRGCLDGSSYDACVDEGECASQAPNAFHWAGGDDRFTDVQVSTSYILACAPNWLSLIYLISRYSDEPDPPSAFDQDAWIGYCLPYTDETSGEILVGCVGEDLQPNTEGHTLGEGIPVRVTHIRPEGTDIEGWHDRPGFLQSMRLSSGLTASQFWAGPSPGIAPLSAPMSSGGWGVNPTWLTPDGTDPTWPDDTFARDFVAAYTLKTSTARNGVLVSFDNHNRCESWQGPDDLGRYRCERLGVPVDGWNDDGYNADVGDGVFSIPIRTIASTGLPDPDVPGGAAIHVAGSPSFEQIEHWAYPHTWLPDLIPYDDAPTTTTTAGAGAIEGEAYRFDGHPDRIRMVMGSNWQRFPRPRDGEGDRP